MEIGRGLISLHEMDVVHRDVKPSNILFDEKGQALLADLGLAQMPSGPSGRSRGSEAAFHPGTPDYKSPEQVISHAALPPASDIYTLGSVLFEMLSLRQYRGVRPGTALTKYRKDAPEWLAMLLKQMLSKNQEERPWDGEELVERLQELKREAEEQARKEAEAIAKREKEERERKVREARAKKEAEEKARQEEVEEKLRKEAEAKREKEERERKAREARAKKEAEEKLRKEAEAKREKEERERKVREARAKKEGEEKAKREKAKRARIALRKKLKVPEMVKIPAGEFLMGSDKSKDADAGNSETPQHTVHEAAFEIAKNPVTVAQFEVFINDSGYRTTAEEKGTGWGWAGKKWAEIKGANWRNPRGRGSDVSDKAEHPVTQVSWQDAVAYCRWLSEQTGQNWRLPSEAEWEKAARGPDGRKYPWGEERPGKTLCNFDGNEGDTTPVGNYPKGASPYGVLDMSGNVWEWVADWYAGDYYASSPKRNPFGPETGSYRVLRGGSWLSSAGYVRSACRDSYTPVGRDNLRGFRPARS